MASLETVTESHARRQKALAQRTAAQIATLWTQVDPASIAPSWRLLIPTAVTALATSQATAAASAGIYVDDALEAQNFVTDAEGRVSATAFAGVASDGRQLSSLLYEPAISTLIALQRGDSPARARATGLMRLDTIVRTQVADAGRSADLVAIAVRPRVKGYVRMLSLPSCSRCVILAGRVYRWNSGFRRHPRCDCRHIPTAENAEDLRTDPKAAFASMSEAEQKRVFGVADAAAIRDGADMAKVVNANRGTYLATAYGRTLKATREGAGRRLRLMPEEILREAKGSRSEAIRLLRLNGYVR